MVVKGADPKIQELFDWIIGLNGQGLVEDIELIVNIKTSELEGSFSRKIEKPTLGTLFEKNERTCANLCGVF